MLVVTIRSDKPEAEVGLFEAEHKLAYEIWPAHRELSATLHQKIKDVLDSQQKDLKDVTGIVCFKGPGSFTGLRIGLTVADSLAYGLSVPIIGAMGEDWIETGIRRLQKGDNDRIALPHYGSPAHITERKK